ncbi:MAG: chromosome segregation protein SMC [Candidatus Limnocylindrales bacterium]|jgi:chromosome segregation protein
MTAPARLLALRLQGFKSFGERTVVEFGPGISAVVGPNGSGKSNLADALRWALGEQGKALRLRKSEDVIFVGSEKRSALGMADVTLVLGNADRLLPIDYATVELGRRLFRSGENDYLLNRQRVRLKDLVDLLDAAHLADNAFLFIGQGMVDQALALRPEERRPLFEEVAGVRRHERRKARAEGQLAEAEANLARVEDVLAELRPQARRLAAQAEQQASRQTAGLEYGRAIIAVARARWVEAAGRSKEADRRLRTARTEADASLTALREAEARAATVARDLASRSETEAERRAAHEAARDVLTELQLRDARAAGNAAGVLRDRGRLESELASAEADLAIQRRELAGPVLTRDLALSEALAEADRALAEALEELGAIRAARQAEGDALAALRRVETARAAELETARRRLGEASRAAAAERAEAELAARRLAETEAACAGPRAAALAATEAEKEAVAAREKARAELEALEGARQAAADRAGSTASKVASLQGRLEAVQAQLAGEAARGIARAARRLGGKPLAEGLEVEAGFRVAVEAALGEALRGYVIGREGVLGLEGQRGTVVLESGDGGAASAASGTAAVASGAVGAHDGGRAAERAAGRAAAEATEAAVAAASSHGGGKLVDAIRVDTNGAALRLLARTIWLPDLNAALAVQPRLPAGWIAVTRDGAVVTAAGVVTMGRSESLLDRRAEVERLGEEAARMVVDARAAATEADSATWSAAAARAALDAARDAERRAGAARREAEEAERRAARELESVAREAAWLSAQAARAEAEQDRLAAAARQAEAGIAEAAGTGAAGTGAAEGASSLDSEQASALRQWEARAAALRSRRDRLAGEEATFEATRREAENRRARAAAAAELDQARMAQLERQMAELVVRERSLAAEREGLGEELAAATLRDAAARAELDEIRSAGAVARAQLADAEAAAAQSRERLRVCQDRVRSAEVAELEARLVLDAIREQVLVELAGLGDLGLRLLAGEGHPDDEDGKTAPADGTPRETAEEGVDESAADSLEEALASAAERWARGPAIEPPAPTRLAVLRRRFHELGAPNPFAAEEHQTVKARLDGLERQRADLTAAIARTRALIEQLNTMISSQFRSTFQALEMAFGSRFRQLFGGGFARLSLTDPEDLAATGIEIVARPPGKKAQPLSMLSGGERALTAVALLFAMLEVHPVPFCVLDEVDAALDEANIGRFAEALRGLADRTQFIVITHNRGTIESADALYGVTVSDDAVSRVISLRLEEAREMADRVSRENDAATAAPGS